MAISNQYAFSVISHQPINVVIRHLIGLEFESHLQSNFSNSNKWIVNQNTWHKEDLYVHVPIYHRGVCAYRRSCLLYSISKLASKTVME